MYILNSSLKWRIAVFGYVLVLMLLPAEVDFLMRSTLAVASTIMFFWLLPSVSYEGFEAEGWMMWLDFALSWVLLWAYALTLLLIAFAGITWWSVLVSLLILGAAAYSSLCWFGLRTMLEDDLLRSSA